MPTSHGPWVDAPDEVTPPSTVWWMGSAGGAGSTTWAQPGDTEIEGFVEVVPGNPDFPVKFEESAGGAVADALSKGYITLLANSLTGTPMSAAGQLDVSGYTQAGLRIEFLAPDIAALTFPLIGPDFSTWPPHAIATAVTAQKKPTDFRMGISPSDSS